jgi:hypothetical protein
MKMMKICMLLLLLVAVTSCKKDVYHQEANALRLTGSRALNINGHYILTTRTYFSDGKLQKEESLDEATGIKLTQNFYYDGEKLDHSIIKSAVKEVSKIIYVYQNNMLSKMHYLESNSAGQWELNFEKIFEFKDQRLSKITILPKVSSTGSRQELTFAGNDLIGVKNYSSDNKLVSSTSYEYDKKTNPYYSPIGRHESVLEYSVNNPVKVTFTDAVNSANNHEYVYQYQYNSNGYPTQSSVVGAAGQLTLETTFNYSSGI